MKGFLRIKNFHYNLNYTQIKKHYIRNNEGYLVNTKYGKVRGIDTGKFTGRSPQDKYIVNNVDNIWWGEVNKPMPEYVFDDLYKKCVHHYSWLDDFYVFEGYCGASKENRRSVRFFTEYVWQHHFVKNMFIESPIQEPDFTIINGCNVVNEEWKEQKLNSEIFITFNIPKKIGLIGGTHYGGCMKKGMFTMMNYWLPLQGVMSMHCSANIGANGDTALFFGLSGTGKTTLSADSSRQLIGDDEHGWDDKGIFNLEGGCYAKTLNLSEEKEPEIYKAIKPNALLENISLDGDKPLYNDDTKTQNGRVSYPINHIPNYKKDSLGNHPENIIFLTCDAFGVLPPVSRLTTEQAMFHFLLGYTAKIAGTERGIDEPQATFSSCFGAAFLPLHPKVYAELLAKKINEHQSKVWLVNTGWSGGSYGTGERMDISLTKKCIQEILQNKIKEFEKEDYFGLHIPKKKSKIYNPVYTWENKSDYEKTAKKLAEMFDSKIHK
jgi:phosphoenolpyruvate carboxykinase (ATP)